MTLKKYFSYIYTPIFLLTSLGLNTLLFPDFASASLENYVIEEKKFTVSAYYSPLPGQKYYATGSYEGDLRLNGYGVNGASGNPVSFGMLAAPKTYPFGTKIDLKGLGVGVVEDRGGAIVKAGERGYKNDRLDVWVGYGEKGLKRALLWGKRDVEGIVYSPLAPIGRNISVDHLVPYGGENLLNLLGFSRSIKIGFSGRDVDMLHVILRDLGWLRQDFESDEILFESIGAISKYLKEYDLRWANPPIIDMSIINRLVQTWVSYSQNPEFIVSTNYLEPDLSINLGKGSSGPRVKVLQELLLELGFDINITGFYDGATINSVFIFQKDHGIVDSEFDFAAGYFGPGTKDKLLEVYKDFKESTQVNKRTSREESRKNAVNILQSGKVRWQAQYGEKDGGVYTLQQFLKLLGFFEDKPTGKFGPITKDSLIEFQKYHNLVATSNSVGAGTVGPMTTEKLWEEVGNMLVMEYLPQRTLATGNRGKDVRTLQRALAFLGWYEGGLTESYDDQTYEAVASFQKDLGIVSDSKSQGYGVFGPQTRENMELLLKLHPGVYLGLPNEW